MFTSDVNCAMLSSAWQQITELRIVHLQSVNNHRRPWMTSSSYSGLQSGNTLTSQPKIENHGLLPTLFRKGEVLWMLEAGSLSAVSELVKQPDECCFAKRWRDRKRDRNVSLMCSKWNKAIWSQMNISNTKPYLLILTNSSYWIQWSWAPLT